jgi:hypothetical protein
VQLPFVKAVSAAPFLRLNEIAHRWASTSCIYFQDDDLARYADLSVVDYHLQVQWQTADGLAGEFRHPIAALFKAG